MDTRVEPLGRESIVQDLESPDDELRRFAVERIEEVPPGERLALLVEALGDPSWRVRKAAVERVVAHGDNDAVARDLIEALADGDNPGRRNSAVEALVACGSRMLPSLLRAARSDDPDVRKLAVDSLAGISDPDAGPLMLDLLADPDGNVRAAAADALGGLANPGSGSALLSRAVDTAEDATVRFSCLRALGGLEEPLLARDLTPALEDPILRAAALDLLRNGDDEDAVSILLKGLAAGSRSVREAAIRSLVRLLGRRDGEHTARLVARVREAAAAEPAVTESAIARLADADLATRLVLVQFLGLFGNAVAVVPMLQAGRDEALSPVVLETLAVLGERAEEQIDAQWQALAADLRRDACVVFGRTNGAAGAARLLHCLGDAEPEVRIAAIGALAERRHAPAVPLLVKQLEAAASSLDFEAEDELQAIAQALVTMATPAPDSEPLVEQLVELLRAQLEGASERVRLEIAQVFGAIGRREESQLVAFLLKDPSSRVRRAAVDALARLTPGSASEPLRLALADEAPMVRIAAAAALATAHSDDVTDDLLRLAEDDEAPVRAAAVRALCVHFGASTNEARRAVVLEVLEHALDDDARVALGAVEGLTALGGPLAAGVIGVLARDEPELVREAVTCVARHSDADSLEQIVPLVSHPDWSVRAEAIESLAERRVMNAAPAILRQLVAEQDEFVRDVILRALERLEV